MIFVGVCTELFWHAIYCAKPRPDDRSQSVSRYRMVLGSQYLQIIREYDLATAILI